MHLGFFTSDLADQLREECGCIGSESSVLIPEVA